MNVSCPSCKSDSVTDVGKIPPTDSFAGVLLQIPISGGNLYRCKVCNLHFRYPTLTKPEFDELYQQGADDSWNSDFAVRRDWLIATIWIKENITNGKVLDVGCFDGGLLECLGAQFVRYGIEIHKSAAAMAQKKGVTIIGSDYLDLIGHEPEFDVVTAIDVIEHAYDPLRFLEILSGVVKPCGFLIISSGNTDALSWRLMGGRYWYCTIAEHVSFINSNWCKQAADKLGFSVVSVKRYSHCTKDGFSIQWLKESIKNLFFLFFPGISAKLREAGIGKKDVGKHEVLKHHPPVWTTSQDHIIVLMKKNSDP